MNCALHIVACQDYKVHIASLVNTCMSMPHSRHVQCYLKIRYILGGLRSGYITMRNAQCSNSEDNLFLIRCMYNYTTVKVMNKPRSHKEKEEEGGGGSN